MMGQVEVESKHSPSKFYGAEISFSKRGDRLIARSWADGHTTFAGSKVAIDMWDYELALTLLDRTCEQLPEAITPHQWRSYLLAAMGRWAEAEADIDWVLEKIDDVPMRLMRVETLYRQSRFDTAISECTKWIEDPVGQSKRGLALRRCCYEATGNQQAAQKDRSEFHAKLGKDLATFNSAAYTSA